MILSVSGINSTLGYMNSSSRSDPLFCSALFRPDHILITEASVGPFSIRQAQTKLGA